MSFKDWFSGVFRKQSPSRTMIAMHSLGKPVQTPRKYKELSEEGYQKNVIAFTAIHDISKAVGSLKWVLYKKRRGGSRIEVDESPLLDLLARPNPMQGGSSFFEAVTAFFFISGNSYIEGVGPNPTSPPTELYPVRPDRMKVIPGSIGLPEGFEYSVNGKSKVYKVDQIKGTSPILHLKTFNPLNDWYGMGRIEAAALSVDQHNQAGIWNLSLLQNKATPSGALVYLPNDANPKGKLDDDQYTRLDKKLEEKFMGSKNAGRPLLLEGGLDWRAMGFSPSDMDWINGKNVSAKDIALALGYPPMLLGIQGDSTYNNQKEANMALYTKTVLPTADMIRDELNHWLTPLFGEDLYLDYDKDEIDALAPLREAIWDRVQNSGFLTINEKRSAIGYEALEGGDTLMVDAGKLPLELAVSDDFLIGSEEEDDPDEEDDDLIEEEVDDDSDEGGKSIEYKNIRTRFLDFVKRFSERYSSERVSRIQDSSRDRVIKAIRKAQVDFLNEGSTIDQLSNAIQENVKSVYETFSKSRARTIARTETTVAANEGSRAAAKSLGVPNLKKEWVSGDDSRTRGSDPSDDSNHKSMNGVKVEINEKFLVPSKDGPDSMDGPGDPSAPADQVVNCRCILVYDDDSKSFNLSNRASKHRLWLKTIRQRNALERKFSAQLRGVFLKEMEEILSALEGIEDARLAERTVEAVLDDTKADLETVFKSNISTTLNKFGSEVLKLRS